MFKRTLSWSMGTLSLGMLLLVVLQATSMSLVGPETEMTPTLNGDWKVYIDDKWGYSVLYPPDWTTSLALNNIGGPEYVVQRRVTLVGPEYAQVDIDVYKNQSSLSLLEWCASNYSATSGSA